MKRGLLIWVTGFSGSGKSKIVDKIYKSVASKYGPTVKFHGDELRKIMDLNKFSKKDREKNGLKYSKLFKNITNQGINVLVSVVAMSHKVRNENRKKIKKYFEVYVKSDINFLIQKSNKKHYRLRKRNIVGLDIKAEEPKMPDLIIYNDFKENLNSISKKIVKALYLKFK